MTKQKSRHLLEMLAEVPDSCKSPGLFSFKNYQLMRVTDSLFRRSGRAVAKPIGVNLRKYLSFY